jgi:hypothetical protein
MHMWHYVTNHLIIFNDKDFNSENRIKLRVRDSAQASVLVEKKSVTVVLDQIPHLLHLV